MQAGLGSQVPGQAGPKARPACWVPAMSLCLLGFLLGVCWRMFPARTGWAPGCHQALGSEEETTPPLRLSVLIISSNAGGQRKGAGAWRAHQGQKVARRPNPDATP